MKPEQEYIYLMNSIKRSIPMLLLVVFGFKCGTDFKKSSVRVDRKINGISVAAGPQLFDSTDVQQWKKINSTWVCFMPYGFIDEATGNVYFNQKNQWKGETKEGICHSIAFAKKHKLNIFIKPQLWSGHGAYTGNIAFEENSEQWQNFKTEYTKFIELYIKIADSLECNLFSIGTELNKLVTGHPEFWNNMIDKFSKYPIALTYAENWDVYENVPFWSKLNFIGVNAYFPVSKEKKCSAETLKKNWNEIIGALETTSSNNNKPILFTEFGYRSIDYCGKEPWNYTKDHTINYENQRICIESLFNNCWDKSWFAGGFLWKEYGHKHPAEMNGSGDFTVFGKAAEKTIAEHYQKTVK